MVERKSRVLAFFWTFLLWNADAMVSVFNNGEEWQLLKTRGYRGNSGDFARIKSDVVHSYGLELSRLDPENRHIEVMQLYLRRILGDINYPIGHGKLECGISGYWNILVAAEESCVKAANEGREAFESEEFCSAVKSILTHLGLIFPSLSQHDDRKGPLSKLKQGITKNVADGIEAIKQYSAEPCEGKAVKGKISDCLISINTPMSIDAGFGVECETKQDKEKQKAVKLLADVLVKRLIVCLPTPAEICFWKLREVRRKTLPGDFRSFEESLGNFLLRMRYEIRNGVRSSSEELLAWMSDFVGVYKRFPVLPKIKTNLEALLEKSMLSIGLSDSSSESFALREIGRVILDAGPTKSCRVRKPFIVACSVNDNYLELIEKYLTSGLKWAVHVVSAKNLKDSNKDVVLGESWSWKDITGLKEVNKGWILDTFMEVVKNKKTDEEESFLNNVLLIKDSDRFLDEKRISKFGGIGDTLSSFINNLVSENCNSMAVPYLGTSVNTEHLITIMATKGECVRPGVSTIKIGNLMLRPSLVLSFPKQKKGSVDKISASETEGISSPKSMEISIDGLEIESDRSDGGQITAYQSPFKTVSMESISEKSTSPVISKSECRAIMEESLKKQGKVLKEEVLESEFGRMLSILSGNAGFFSDEFACLKGYFDPQEDDLLMENFLENGEPELIKALINEFAEKL